MKVIFILLFAFATVCNSSPIGEYEKEMRKEGIDLEKQREELKRESEEVEREFADEETQKELSKLRASCPSAANDTIQEKTEQDLNGDVSKYLFQGDIVLTREQWAAAMDLDPTARLQRRQALPHLVRRWMPMGAPIIPYSYAPGFPEITKPVITKSFAFWEERTCIKFRPATTTDKNVIEFDHNPLWGCSASIGMVNGKQNVNLAPGCFSVAIVTHELSHAFGTFHVQTRSDRDGFVIVDTANIQRGQEHNFAKDPPDSGKTNFGIPYEYGSIMHYHEKAFAIDPSKPTIYARPAFAQFQKSMEGPRPSFYDTLLINRMYTCTAKCTTSLACMNNGVQDGSNCSRCFCPRGWAGTNCEKRPDNANHEACEKSESEFH